MTRENSIDEKKRFEVKISLMFAISHQVMNVQAYPKPRKRKLSFYAQRVN